MIRNYALGNQTIFDVLKREVVSPEEKIKLGGREAEILKLLCMHANELVSKEQIHQNVWGKVLVSETSLTKAISNLRKCLAQLDSLSCEIKTIPKAGYMLVCDNGEIFESSGEVLPEFQVEQIHNVDALFEGSKLVTSYHCTNSELRTSEIAPPVVTGRYFILIFVVSLLASLTSVALLLLLR